VFALAESVRPNPRVGVYVPRPTGFLIADEFEDEVVVEQPNGGQALLNGGVSQTDLRSGLDPVRWTPMMRGAPPRKGVHVDPQHKTRRQFQ